jgi:thioesterase domain-containing protein
MFIKNEEFPKKSEKFIGDEEELTQYILENIPILNSVSLSVSDLTENSIKLTAPLYENRNHYGSAFGGSIATVGIVAGWAILTYKIKEEKVPTTLVIKNSHTEYKRPVKDEFYAEVIIDNTDWQKLKNKFSEKGKAGIEVTSKIISNGEICTEQKSVYVCIEKT